MVKIARSVEAIEKMAEMSATNPAMRMTLSSPDNVRKVTDALNTMDALQTRQLGVKIPGIEPNPYHDTRARANDKHRSSGSQPALFVHSVVSRTVKEEVRNTETQAGYRKVHKNARERPAVDWRCCGFGRDVFGQGFVG